MGGMSGVLFKLLFCKMVTYVSNQKKLVQTVELSEAFQEDVNAVSFYGGATVGSHTILDALHVQQYLHRSNV